MVIQLGQIIDLKGEFETFQIKKDQFQEFLRKGMEHAEWMGDLELLMSLGWRWNN